jgi:hypothetical protein
MIFVDCTVARNDRVNGVCIIGKLSQKDMNLNEQKDVEKKTFMVKETVTNTVYSKGDYSNYKSTT